jgi:HEAT repeat protein
MKCIATIIPLFFLLTVAAFSQAPENVSLDQKVRDALQESCSYEGCGPMGPRLLKVGPANAVSAAVLRLAEQYKNAKAGQRSEEYSLLMTSVFALGKLQWKAALPLLIDFATRTDGPQEITVFAIQSIGEIDAEGNKAVLLGALKSQDFFTRRIAAEALSKTNDSSVLTELEVAASQEDHLDQSRVIQALADSMRTRMHPIVK